jgi:MarR family transcriptional regulator, 2-MHQ and catechol-resistance regulon repressor
VAVLGPPAAKDAPALVPEEADVLLRVADLPVDMAAMAVASNLWRAAQALRAHLERSVLREEGLSWGGFTVLFNLWVWGPMESRALAASIGCARPTVTGLVTTLERRRLVRRAGHERDRRLVLLSLTPEGTAKIEELFPRFNRGEAALVNGLSDEERTTLAQLLRRIVLNAKDAARAP